MTLNLPLSYWFWFVEYCQTSPNKNKSPNLWHVTSILVCCIFVQVFLYPWYKQLYVLAIFGSCIFVMDYLRTFSSQEYRKNIISQKKSFLTDVQKNFQNKIPKIRSWLATWRSFLKYYPVSTYEFPVKEIRTY